MATLRSALAQLFPAANATANANMSDGVGNKTDAAVSAVGTTKSLFAYVKGILNNLNGNTSEIAKMDTSAADGLSGVSGSLAYMIHEMLIHLNNPNEWYGTYDFVFTRGYLTPFNVVAGDGAFGGEKIMYAGSGISQSFKFNKINVSEVSTADRITFLEWYTGVLGAGPLAATYDSTTDAITDAAHGLEDGDTIVILDFTSGLTYSDVVFYVVNKTTDTFQLSYTSGGAAIDIGGPPSGTLHYRTITRTLLTETYLSKDNATPDMIVDNLQGPSIAASKYITCRGKALGGTNTVKFFAGIQVYP